MKKGNVVIYVGMVLAVLLMGIVSAQEGGDIRDSGLTPDSPFYFLDEFFDQFGDTIEVKEEKIAEIKAMIEAGKIDAAREALDNYRKHAEELEKEIDPDKTEDAKRSAGTIQKALEDIESLISEEHKEDFYNKVLEKEQAIITSAEIASKIKELCEVLAKVDPSEYARVCKTNEDAPEWQKRLDKDLTDKQRDEARKFGKIMSQCFETSGQECRCEEIPFPDFAAACSKAAPLAVACDIENDEDACDKLDALEMPELPDHLQDIFDELERDIGDAQFDLHMPPECREAGATSPQECRKVMITTHAPPECRDALINANIQGEREGREICEKIMFEQNAPRECVEAGLRDHKECGRFMFQREAPEECIEAGLTGENRNDHRKCQEIMEKRGRNEGGPGTGFHGPDCRRIEDSKARLDCYDGITQGFGKNDEQDTRGFEDRYRETKERERQCAQQCSEEGGAWDFSGGKCTCRFDNNPQNTFENYKEDYKEYPDEYSKEPGKYQEYDQEYQEEYREESEDRHDPSQVYSEEYTEGKERYNEENNADTSNGGEEDHQESEESNDDSKNVEEGSPAGITGNVIGGNKFLDYFYRR